MTRAYWTKDELVRAQTRCIQAIREAEECGAAEEIIEGMRAGLWAIGRMIENMEERQQ